MDILHSQFYILKILSAALTFRWQIHRDSQRDPQSPTLQEAQPRRQPSRGSMASSAGFIDVLPLSEDVAQYTLSVMVLILRQTSSVADRPRTVGLMYNEYVPDFHTVDAVGLTNVSPSATIAGSSAGTTRQGAPESSIGRGSTISSSLQLDASSPSWTSPGAASIPSLPLSAYPYASGMHGPSKPPRATGYSSTNTTPALTSLVAPAAASYSDTPTSVSWLVYRYAARVVFAVSASNWDIVFSKVRGWIRTAHASSTGNTSDEPVDVMDMKLVACSAMDATRLGSILSGE